MDASSKSTSPTSQSKDNSKKPVVPFKCVTPNRLGWYCVYVYSRYRNQKKMDSNTLLNTLKELCNTNNISWNPYYLDEGEGKEVGNLGYPICTFYVNNFDQAKELNRLKVPDEIRLQLKVTNNRVPHVRLDPSLREKLRLAILKHYRPIRESLDLFCFHKDDQWKEDFFSLEQKSCMSAAIDVMEKYMPKLRSLILDNNCLTDLSAFQGIEHRLPQLTYISLIFNDLRNVTTLQVFEHLSLTQLDIAHNPLDTPIKRQHLAKLLPKLILLDGKQVEALDETTSQIEKADGEEHREQIPKQVLESSVKLEKTSKSDGKKELQTQEADHRKQQQNILKSSENGQSKTQEAVQIKQQLPEPGEQIPKHVPEHMLKSSVKLEKILESSSKPTEPTQPKSLAVKQVENPIPKPVAEKKHSQIQGADRSEQQQPEPVEKIPKLVPKHELKSSVKLENIPELNETTQSQTRDANQIKKQLPKPEKQIPKQVRKSSVKLEKILELNENTQSQTREANQTKQQLPEPGVQIPQHVPEHVLKSSVKLEKIPELSSKPTEQTQPNSKAVKQVQNPIPKPEAEKKHSQTQGADRSEQQQPETVEKIPQQVHENVPKSSVKRKTILESNEEKQSQTEKADHSDQHLLKPAKQIPKKVPENVPESCEKLKKLPKSDEKAQSQTQEANQKQQLPVVKTGEQTPKRVLESSVNLEKIPKSEENTKSQLYQADHKKQQLPKVETGERITKQIPTKQTQPKSLEVEQVEVPIPKPVAEKKHSQTQGTDHSEHHLPEPEEKIPKQVKLEKIPVLHEKTHSQTQKAENIEYGKIPILSETTQSQIRQADHIKHQLAGEDPGEQTSKQVSENVLRLKPTNQIQLKALELEQVDPQKPKPVYKKARSQTQESEPENQILRQVPEHVQELSLKWKPIPELELIEGRIPIRLLTFQESIARKNDLQRFLNEYLRIYDYDSERSGLEWFYQETAVVKFTTSQEAFASCLDFLPDQLNKKFNHVKDGIQIENRDSALAHFASLPKSQHLLPTIIVDMMEMRHERVCFAISGFLKYLNTTLESPKFHYFMRCFVLTPLPDTADGPDFRISSEVVYTCDASREQLIAGVIPTPQSESHFVLNILEPLLPDIFGLRKLQQDDLVLRLSRQTQMKWKWSRKCLIDYHWDLEASLKRVKEMKDQNLIPKEGFLPKHPKSVFGKIF